MGTKSLSTSSRVKSVEEVADALLPKYERTKLPDKLEGVPVAPLPENRVTIYDEELDTAIELSTKRRNLLRIMQEKLTPQEIIKAGVWSAVGGGLTMLARCA